MKLSPRQYAEFLYEISAEAHTKDLPDVIKSFIKILIRDRKIVLLPRIISEFEKVWRRETGIGKITIVSSEKISTKIRELIKKELKDKFEIEEKIDPNLIGGFVIKEEDRVIDGSVKGMLNELRRL